MACSASPITSTLQALWIPIQKRPALAISLVASAALWAFGASLALSLGCLALGIAVEALLPSQKDSRPVGERLKADTKATLDSLTPQDFIDLGCTGVNGMQRIPTLGNGSCAFNGLALACYYYNLRENLPSGYSELAQQLKARAVALATYDEGCLHLPMALRELVDGHLKEYMLSEKDDKGDRLTNSLGLSADEFTEISRALDREKGSLIVAGRFALQMNSQDEAAKAITSRVVDLKGGPALLELYKTKMQEPGFHSSGYEFSLLAQDLNIQIRVYSSSGYHFATYGEGESVISLCFENDHYDALLPINHTLP